MAITLVSSDGERVIRESISYKKEDKSKPKKNKLKLSNTKSKLKKLDKLLKKPKAKLPSYSAVKTIKGLADEARPLVREVEERKFEEPRSLFFKEEFNKERRKVGWI